MEKNLLDKYAEVVIKKGINLYKGQCLSITGSIIDYPFAIALSECAYKNGAMFVDINVISNELIKARLDHSKREDLDFIPQYKMSQYNEYLAHDWAFIRIDNTGEHDVLMGSDSSDLEVIFRADRKVKKRYLELAAKHRLTWCVIAGPNTEWAMNIFKNDSPENATLKLYEALKKILRLDKEDSLNAWDEHCKKLVERSMVLDELKFDKVVIKSTRYKTELEIGLNKYSKWVGGPKKTPDGRIFIPNIPTEEVFTTPDFSKTNGIVHTTRPVMIMETILDGVWFEFKDGKVIDFGSKNNKDLLEKFLNTDSGSRSLGEIALVDSSSLIYQSNLIFKSILYDENASCHIALGNGYPSCLTIGQTLNTKEELINAGCNVSLVHTDFMIGSDDTEVMGYSADGKKHAIIKNGIFCF